MNEPKYEKVDIFSSPAPDKDEDKDKMGLLKEFHAMCSEVFRKPNELEELDKWIGRSKRKDLKFHCVLAVDKTDPASSAVCAGLIAEYYTWSKCGLLRYAVVKRDCAQADRLEEDLLKKASSLLRKDALSHKTTIQAIYSEIRNPAKSESRDEYMRQVVPFVSLHDEGTKLDLSYRRPPIHERDEAAENFYLGFHPALAQIGARISDEILICFLESYYRSYSSDPPGLHQNFVKMVGELENRKEFENPFFKFRKAAVSLHFVQSDCDEWHPTKKDYGPWDPFWSWEKDDLSHPFRDSGEIVTRKVGEREDSAEVTIHFPETTTFYSEGRKYTKKCEREACKRDARATLSHTYFSKSRIRVWHLVLVPQEGDYFTELDVIKLTTQYDKLQEKSECEVKYSVGNLEEIGPLELIQHMAHTKALPGCGGPQAGIVNLDMADSDDDNLEWVEILKTLNEAKGDDP